MGSVRIANLLLGGQTKRYIDRHILSKTSSSFLLNYPAWVKAGFGTHNVPHSAQVIICGAGATGNSVAYHMNENGWKDIIVLEQSKIGSGDSWRSCGIVGHFHSMSEGRMTTYSSELYKKMQNEGHDMGFVETGSVNVARTNERMIELRRIAAEARIHGIKCDILEPKDISNYHPFAKSDDLVGGIWVPSDGIVNPLSVCQALAKISQDRGVKYFEGCKVLEILTNGFKVTGVKTSLGVINCEYLVLCAGMWTRSLGVNCVPPFRVPTQPAENGYVITRPVPGVSTSTPLLRDYDACVYVRPYDSGFMVGGFPEKANPLFTDKMPDYFSFQELTPNWEYFKPVYEEACFRVPILKQADIQRYSTGPDTFTPDGHWILGETSEIDNLYVAAGMNVNAVQGAGGLGKELADWITTGEPKAYLLPFDIRRFIDFHNNAMFLRERVQEAKTNVGYAGEVLVMGFNNTGEPGYSLYIPSEYALHVYHNLLNAGKDYGIRNVGYYALRFLRIEKFIPFWAEELDSHTTPFEVGRGFKVRMQKEYFLGKMALQQQLDQGMKRRLVHFLLENHNPEADIWAWGREPIYRNGRYVGKTTSSGYGFTLQRVVCLGFVHNYDEKTGEPQVVPSEFISNDAHFEIEIAGKRFPAKASLNAPPIPIITMNGTSNRYTPKARLVAHTATPDS
ncbi:Pyruvate dehydrogenase phosphatase regulatory subunit, mitochondrial [Araneus ventricosus]|uniref:Pyruvate dehydrogenase phosphatase regulatory subunit, mitochondrial n=1 Tax=Araneus ventricosus TaxID=182803 RepID=A0A4Y2NF07_ARAVE|nr:Pyruvate dehydrogenase phosphatase regulatory subunit, mitochondrial [Araneus ventricosus]